MDEGARSEVTDCAIYVAGDDQIVQEAHSFLQQLEALTASAPEGSAKKATAAE